MEAMKNAIPLVTMQDLLTTWNLQQYIKNFEDEDIHSDVLNELISSEWLTVLEGLIPVAGHRIRFIKKAKEFLASVVEQPINQSNDCDNVMSDDGSNSITLLNTICQQNISENKDPTSLSAESSNYTESNNKRRLSISQENQPAKKRIAPNHSENEIHQSANGKISKRDLRSLLSKTGTGRCLLAQASRATSLKLEKDQNKLAELIIEEELAKSSKIEGAAFSEIVEAIKSIFPDEDAEIYYIPYRMEGNHKCLAKGKLVFKYYSLRKQLRAVGLLSTDKDEIDSGQENEDSSEGLKDIQEKLNFLKDNTEPWDIVLEYWRNTSKARIRMLQSSSELPQKKNKFSRAKPGPSNSQNQEFELPKNISSYLSDYPVLRERLGYTLFEIDFEILYPDHKLKVYSNWDDFSAKVFAALQAEEIKSPALKDNLALLEDDAVDRDVKTLITLLSLCHLDSVTTVTRLKKEGKITTWRPPLVELQEGLISLIDSSGKLDTFISKRYEKFSHWKLTFQPFCVVCGSAVDDIDSCYVVLDRKTKYLISSPLRALDICFKAIHATHAQYSTESYRLWMFIQKKLYGLDTRFDNQKNDAQLLKLLKKLK